MKTIAYGLSGGSADTFRASMPAITIISSDAVRWEVTGLQLTKEWDHSSCAANTSLRREEIKLNCSLVSFIVHRTS